MSTYPENAYAGPPRNETKLPSRFSVTPADHRPPRRGSDPTGLPVRELAIVAASAVAGILLGVIIKRGGKP